jgi:hypothetical protein
MRSKKWMRWGVAGAAGLAVLSLGHAGYSFQGGAAPGVPPLVLENFEAATLNAKPYLWKEGKQVAAEAKVGADRSALDGDDANKALKYEYTFPAVFDAAQGVEAGPMNQALPGSLTGISMMVHGDGSKNAIAVRLKDKLGETFEWRIPVTTEAATGDLRQASSPPPAVLQAIEARISGEALDPAGEEKARDAGWDTTPR